MRKPKAILNTLLDKSIVRSCLEYKLAKLPLSEIAEKLGISGTTTRLMSAQLSHYGNDAESMKEVYFHFDEHWPTIENGVRLWYAKEAERKRETYHRKKHHTYTANINYMYGNNPTYRAKLSDGLRNADKRRNEKRYKVGDHVGNFVLEKICNHYNVWSYKGLYTTCFMHNEAPVYKLD